jgi:hypothetical protein
MSTAKLSCPQCQAPLKFLKSPKAGKSVTCPGCGLKFVPPEVVAAAPPAQPQPPANRSFAVACGLLLLVGVAGVVGWQIGQSSRPAEQAEAAPAPDAASSSDPAAEAPPSPASGDVTPSPMPAPSQPQAPDTDDAAKTPVKKKPAPKTYAEMKRPKEIDAVPTLATTKFSAPAHPQQARINAAIDKGVAYLRRTQHDQGWTSDAAYTTGYAALGGLTLLEGGVPAEHASVQKAAALVRGTPSVGHRTYEVSLAILFLDRLGDKRDIPLIQALALQVIAGHNANGAWGYGLPTLTPQQSQNLLTFLQKNPLKLPAARANDDATRDVDRKAAEAKKKKMPVAAFPAFQAPLLAGGNLPDFGFPIHSVDNSNSQFALLALWAARRHGVPVERSLLLAADRYAATQSSDGGWGYTANMIQAGTTPSMTCVGLLGLAMGHGVLAPGAADGAAPAAADPRIDAGLKCLGEVLEPNLHNLYFVWSLERVGVLYNLPTIGKKDWYDLGVRQLLGAQQPDGSWGMGGYPGATTPLDTCFAVLFLKRSNLVQDLTDRLPLHMAITDPGPNRR